MKTLITYKGKITHKKGKKKLGDEVKDMIYNLHLNGNEIKNVKTLEIW